MRTISVETESVVNDGRDFPRDGRSLGELGIRSNTVVSEYFKDPVATKRAFTDG